MENTGKKHSLTLAYFDTHRTNYEVKGKYAYLPNCRSEFRLYECADGSIRLWNFITMGKYKIKIDLPKAKLYSMFTNLRRYMIKHHGRSPDCLSRVVEKGTFRISKKMLPYVHKNFKNYTVINNWPPKENKNEDK